MKSKDLAILAYSKKIPDTPPKSLEVEPSFRNFSPYTPHKTMYLLSHSNNGVMKLLLYKCATLGILVIITIIIIVP